MIVTYSYKDELKLDGKYTESICPNCGHTTNKFLANIKRRVSVFFIPVFKKTLKRGLMCTYCGNFEPMSNNEYKKAVSVSKATLAETMASNQMKK